VHATHYPNTIILVLFRRLTISVLHEYLNKRQDKVMLDKMKYKNTFSVDIVYYSLLLSLNSFNRF
jgi:hypothetical protein